MEKVNLDKKDVKLLAESRFEEWRDLLSLPGKIIISLMVLCFGFGIWAAIDMDEMQEPTTYVSQQGDVLIWEDGEYSLNGEVLTELDKNWYETLTPSIIVRFGLAFIFLLAFFILTFKAKFPSIQQKKQFIANWEATGEIPPRGK